MTGLLRGILHQGCDILCRLEQGSEEDDVYSLEAIH